MNKELRLYLHPAICGTHLVTALAALGLRETVLSGSELLREATDAVIRVVPSWRLRWPGRASR